MKTLLTDPNRRHDGKCKTSSCRGRPQARGQIPSRRTTVVFFARVWECYAQCPCGSQWMKYVSYRGHLLHALKNGAHYILHAQTHNTPHTTTICPKHNTHYTTRNTQSSKQNNQKIKIKKNEILPEPLDALMILVIALVLGHLLERLKVQHWRAAHRLQQNQRWGEKKEKNK